jgi:phosphoribosyl-ATP pyrophosphohydrolase
LTLREDMLVIAEKLPKSSMKLPKVASPRVAARRPIVALEGRAARKRH